MKEAGEPSTVGVVTVLRRCARHPGGSHVRTTGILAQRTTRQSKGRADEATTLLHTPLLWVTILLYPTASERGECMLALCSSGYSQHWRWLAPWRSFGDCTYWPAAGFSSEVRAGVDTRKASPARKWRAMGRIEHTLLDEGRGSHPNRPKTFARNRTLPREVADVSIYDKGPEPLRAPPGVLEELH
jgi:hypothetical protein